MVANAFPFLGLPPAERMTDAQVTALFERGRDALVQAGLDFEGVPPDDLRHFLAGIAAAFRDKAPTSAAGAATNPEAAYDYAQLFAGLAAPPWQ